MDRRPRFNWRIFLLKTVVLLALTAGIAAAAYHWADRLFLAPQRALVEAKAEPPLPPPPDPSLEDFAAAVAIEAQGDVAKSRQTWFAFLDRFPDSTKIDEARERLGALNSALYLSRAPAPEKQLYLVKRGDVITRVAQKNNTTPELIMRLNGMTRDMLRFDEKILILPADFTLTISKPAQRVWLNFGGKFFKQYPIREMPPGWQPAKPGAPKDRRTGRVLDKLAFGADGGRIIFTDKGYAEATHWITVNVPGHSLYTDRDPRTGGKATPPQGGGFGLANEHMAEIAALVRKGAAVAVQ